MPRDGSQSLSQPQRKKSGPKPGPRTLRTPENAERICSLIEQGLGLREIGRRLRLDYADIGHWIRDDELRNGGSEIAQRYARATHLRAEMMADELLAVADDRSFVGHPDAAAMVTQQRLAVDTRKWLLSKMIPRKYGDKIEVSSDPDAPVVTRIELVAVHPRARIEDSKAIDHQPDDGEV